jgi:hypothetical protein
VGGEKKKATKPGLVHLGFRGSQELTARIDRLATFMGERLGGVNISRSQVLEVLVNRALPLVEAEYIIENAGFTPAEIKAAIRLVDKEEARILKLRERLPKDK